MKDLNPMSHPREDFSIQHEGSITILWPKSQAASDWCSEHLPDDCPRWGATGYAIETNYVANIIAGMIRDELKPEGK